MTMVSALISMMLAAPMPSSVPAAATERHFGQPGCHALTRAVPRGAAIERDAVEPVPCREQAPAPLAFDRSAALVVAATDLETGAYLGRTVIRAETRIHKGAALRLVSIMGPVRIERTVTAMQPSRGGRIFVRDEDGQVYSARLANAEAGR